MSDAPPPSAERKPLPNLPREPRYDWGLTVIVNEDLYNDGSHPNAEPDALLVPAGTPGVIVNIGHAPDLNAPVYLVEFPAGVLVGCLEEEITPKLGERKSVPGKME